MPSKYTAKININEFHLYSKKDRKNSQDILENYITKDIGQNVKENNDIQDVPVNMSTVFFCYFLLFFFFFFLFFFILCFFVFVCVFFSSPGL